MTILYLLSYYLDTIATIFNIIQINFIQIILLLFKREHFFFFLSDLDTAIPIMFPFFSDTQGCYRFYGDRFRRIRPDVLFPSLVFLHGWATLRVPFCFLCNILFFSFHARHAFRVYRPLSKLANSIGKRFEKYKKIQKQKTQTDLFPIYIHIYIYKSSYKRFR